MNGLRQIMFWVKLAQRGQILTGANKVTDKVEDTSCGPCVSRVLFGSDRPRLNEHQACRSLAVTQQVGYQAGSIPDQNSVADDRRMPPAD